MHGFLPLLQRHVAVDRLVFLGDRQNVRHGRPDLQGGFQARGFRVQQVDQGDAIGVSVVGQNAAFFSRLSRVVPAHLDSLLGALRLAS